MSLPYYERRGKEFEREIIVNDMKEREIQRVREREVWKRKMRIMKEEYLCKKRDK